MKKITGKKGNLTLTIISVVLSLLAVIVAIIVVVAGLKSGPLDGLALYKARNSSRVQSAHMLTLNPARYL